MIQWDAWKRVQWVHWLPLFKLASALASDLQQAKEIHHTQSFPSWTLLEELLPYIQQELPFRALPVRHAWSWSELSALPRNAAHSGSLCTAWAMAAELMLEWQDFLSAAHWLQWAELQLARQHIGLRGAPAPT